MHKLIDDLLITPTTLRRFEIEARLEGGDGRHWALMQRSNGDFYSHGHGPEALPEQVLFAQDMITALNRHLHHEGAWLVTFNQWQKPAPKMDACYTRLTFMWIDKDGDVRFSIEDDRPIWEILTERPEDWLMKCENAWVAWCAAMAALELRQDQTFKQAQGQVAPSVRDPRLLLH